MKKVISYNLTFDYPRIAAYLLLSGMYIPTFYKLFSYGWKRSDYSHGPLILLVFLWLIWKKKEAFAIPSDNRVHPFAFSLLLIGLFIYAIGSVHKILMFETFSLIPVLIGTAGFLFGRDAFKPLLFPAAFLIFLVPPPLFLIDTVTSPLKMMVANVSEVLLKSAGYVVNRNGVVIFMGDYSLVVGDACSGLRSLLSLTAVGAIYVYIQNIRNLKGVLLFLSIIPIAVIANIIRVLLLALITYYFGEEAGQGFLHDFSGMLMFALALASLIILDFFLINRRHGSEKTA